MNFQALKKTKEPKKRKSWKITSMILIGFILMAIATFVIFTINHTHYKVLSILFHIFQINTLTQTSKRSPSNSKILTKFLIIFS